jgi:hypothetical protein
MWLKRRGERGKEGKREGEGEREREREREREKESITITKKGSELNIHCFLGKFSFI